METRAFKRGRRRRPDRSDPSVSEAEGVQIGVLELEAQAHGLAGQKAQIGIVLLIGLASKNAILIVEFAMAEREKGKGIREAAMDAARLRFRPILMTAISSIAGFMPLVVAAGAGAASRQAIGTGVVGGMVAATIMSLIFTPVFYVVMQRLGGFREKEPEKKRKKIAVPASPEETG